MAQGSTFKYGLAALLIPAASLAASLLVFALVRRMDWTLGGLYVGLMVWTLLINLVCLLCWNPELITRRGLPGPGTKAWDWVWMVVCGPAMVAVFVVPVLAAREAGWGDPGAAWLAGLAIFIPAWVLITWSMVVNPFFEKTVRIQTNHGHHVIDAGPYAYVRHPGYVGFAAWMGSVPLMLPSTWAFLPAALVVVGFVVRTALEDRTLQAELPGYAEYATRVRFRLIPGFW
jgi:protein-S-isoprenylcysteine O-methyltransferase Ste14